MVEKQKIMEMLFDDIDNYNKAFDINNDAQTNYNLISKAEALNDFAKKLNKL